jgi:hypothetical protein
MLQEIQVPLENLLLDPNNPRFISGLTEPPRALDEEIEGKQEQTLRRFSRNPPAEDPDFEVTNIFDLYESMCRIGYVGIDKIVVRSIQENSKYLVLEGNRRIATVKSILRDYEKKLSPLDRPSSRKAVEFYMPSFKNIRAMLLDTRGLSKDQIDHQVAILLGIRHHGSLLSWDLLPRAFNIYTEYMEEETRKDKFQFENRRAKAVAERLCIQTGDVTSALKTYVAYLQLRERFPEIQDHHFSLVEYGIKDKHLRAGYLKMNPDTFELNEESLTKLNGMCQFDTRDSKNPERTTNGKKKILQDPKQFKLLGKLINRMGCATHSAVKSYAADLIQRVENEDDLEMTLDQAVDDLTAFENRMKWAEAIEKLLDKQETELSIETYSGEGRDRGYKDELKITLERLRNIIRI